MPQEYAGLNSAFFELYGLLQDGLSKDIFWLRLQHDAHPSVDTTFGLIGLMEGGRPFGPRYWTEAFDRISAEKKRLVLYGTGAQGKGVARNIKTAGRDFWGFCTRNPSRYPGGMMGKPVISPQYLLENPGDFYVMISTDNYYEEIYRLLCGGNFPESRILLHGESAHEIQKITERQYFDFPKFYKPDTAFVDGGCYDSKDSVNFAGWCKGRYSKIFAFEPDSENIKLCRENAERNRLDNFEFVEAGLGSAEAQMRFAASQGKHTGSHFLTGENLSADDSEYARVTTIDGTVGGTKIGFIKLDVEGFESEALLGASRVIARDRPLIAVCVYHKKGDLLAIMEYLHGLIPEYRFWLRHYSIGQNETVLYAAVPEGGTE